jgi:hypothetical protein
MNYQEINVYPNFKKITNIVKLQIQVMDIVLFESVTLRVTFFSEDDVPVENKVMKMDKTNGYDDWKNDDSYVAEWVKQQLKIGIYA